MALGKHPLGHRARDRRCQHQTIYALCDGAASRREGTHTSSNQPYGDALLLLQVGRDRTNVAGMGTAHAKYRIHALLLIRGSIDDRHHEMMVSKLVARAH